MLRCADGSYYVGSARNSDLGRRVAEHQAGAYRGYTSTRRPVHLVWSEYFDRITDAIAAERKIKGWSRAKNVRTHGPTAPERRSRSLRRDDDGAGILMSDASAVRRYEVYVCAQALSGSGHHGSRRRAATRSGNPARYRQAIATICPRV
jgi:predicted GIY-YIG superfamily endonuclease